VNEREGEAIDCSKDICVFVDYVAKRSAIGPFFGFAVAGGDVTEYDTWFVHGGVDGVDNINSRFEITVVVDCHSTNVGVWEEGAGTHYLAIHGKRVMTVVDNSDVHSCCSFITY